MGLRDGGRVDGARTRKGQKNVVAAEDEVVWMVNRIIDSLGLESRLLMAVCGADCLRLRLLPQMAIPQRLSRAD